jgi:hypothetical protein
VEYELVVIREQGEKLAYEAHPSGQPSAVFLSDTVSDSAVVFHNPRHDFPKRVGYERQRKGRPPGLDRRRAGQRAAADGVRVPPGGLRP